MSKPKTVFFCQHCGAQSPKFMGRCPSCGEWNTYVEEVVQRSTGQRQAPVTSNEPKPVHSLEAAAHDRLPLADGELQRVLGGGIVRGSLILFGGEPGIGKSTLMLQVSLQQQGMKVLYVSGEESEEQIRMRVDRMTSRNPACLVLMETSLENILHHARECAPQLLVIDSIQTLATSAVESSPGSISQVRECATQLLRFAKESGTAVFLIGHITKEGTLAGPKVLEHMVDTVLQFEGDRHHVYRLLRAHKNRFGSTSELGIYEMQADGLREVANPSEILIQSHSDALSGTAIAAVLEGVRPLMVEVQALVSTAVYGTPQRSTTGYDLRRLNMLLAVLEKRCGFRLGHKDVFLNIAGGLRIEDPAMDLAVIAAILSSDQDMPVSRHMCFAGEVGLSGEIRPVARMDYRVREAARLGFGEIYISSYNKGIDPLRSGVRVQMAGRVDELLQLLFA
jgi:DNA repair protein RadA/Sms